jgi:hypothetical protein
LPGQSRRRAVLALSALPHEPAWRMLANRVDTTAMSGTAAITEAPRPEASPHALQNTAMRIRYLSNLAALYPRDPLLAARIDAVPFAQCPPLARTRSGNPTVRLSGDDGRELFAHSRYDPVAEARQFVDALPEVDNATFIVHGLGLGYVLGELERRWRRPVALVCESNLALLKAALCVTDLAEMLRSGRVTILTNPDRAALHEKLSAGNADLLLGMQFVAPPASARCDATFHGRMRAGLLDWVSYSRMQMVTLLKTARVTFRNVAFALPHYLRESGVETLKDRAAGFPAIVVAAGPSLARNIRQLAALRERAVIIAVQTVFKPLLALGLRPHFVTSLDFHDVSAEFFRGIDDVGDCVLVAEPKAAPTVLDRYPGRRCVLRHRYFEPLLRGAAPPRGGLRAGSTVAHLAFYLAEHLGCDPLVFVGQDLAFSDGLFYMPGSPIETIWSPEMGRFQTVEMKQWDRVVRNRPILRRTRDIHGRDTFSDDLLFTYSEQFQRDFQNTTRRVILASEGGLPLTGGEVLPLADVAARYCTRTLPPDWRSHEANRQPATARALAELDQRIEELARVKRIAGETSQVLARLTGLLDRPAEFNRLIARVDELRSSIASLPHIYNLVIEVSATGELRRHFADRQLARDEDDSVGSARRRLKRDQEFVAAFLEGCEFLEKTLPEAATRVREGCA